MNDKTKLKIITKTFLCANRGKAFTSREIANFINSGEFKMAEHYVDKKKVSYLINAGRFVTTNMFYGIQMEKLNGLNHYWVS